MSSGYTIVKSSSIIQLKRTLTLLEISTLNTNPVALINAPGVNMFLDIINVNVGLNYGTTPYNESQSLTLMITNGQNNQWVTISSFMAKTFILNQRLVPAATLTSIIINPVPSNQPFTIKASTANPTGGDSTITCYVDFLIRAV